MTLILKNMKMAMKTKMDKFLLDTGRNLKTKRKIVMRLKEILSCQKKITLIMMKMEI